MTQGNTSFNHKLFIDGKEILSSSYGTLTQSGNNRINTLNVTIENVDLQNMALFNKKVELYINESGCDNNVPIFRGYIKRYNPNDKHIVINALDVRTFLSGNDGLKINSDDDNNFDGKTLAQFIYEIISDKINTEDTIIGLDMLRDSNPVITMKDIRGSNLDAYKVIVDKVESGIDDTDYTKPLSFFISIKEDEEKSNITIGKDKQLTDNATYVYSYEDGLISIKYKRNKPANTVYFNGGRVEKYTNRPTGHSVTSIKNLEDVVETRNLGLQQIFLEQQASDEITISVSKGYDIDIGSLIELDVLDDDINGKHRVQAKTISFGKGMNCTLRLNKKPIKLSSYID